MKTKLLRPLFTLFYALLVATVAHSAVIYNNTFPNSNFNTPTSINSNLTSAWTGIGDTPYPYGYNGNNCMALAAHNHVYVLTINIKEGFQVELTSITFNKFSSDNATFQVQVDGVNYGSSFTSSLTMAGITRTKTVSNLRNRMVVRIAVTNSTTPNQNYSGIDNFVLNGSVSSYDPAAEAKPDANGILYVDAGVSIPGDGSSWNHALKRMYYATRAAALKPTVKQVWVVAGTYETEQEDTPFTLTDGVGYYGGFYGDEDDLRQRSIMSNQTILKGRGGHVIAAASAGANTRLDGFVVTAGTGLAAGGARQGGGLYMNNSTGIIANCIFYDNHTLPSAADGKGGAIYLLNSSPTILQSLFAGNSAKGTVSGMGGAIYAENSSPVIRNCTFSTNETGGGSAPGNGAAIFAAGSSSPVIENSIVWDNTDPASPGGTSSISGSGTPTVSYSLIQGGFGGGTNILDTDPQFTDPSQNNFIQRKGSPVTDAGKPGTDLSDFPKNYDDTPVALDDSRRLTSTGIDLGPFEVTPSAIWYVNATSSIPDPSGDSWPNAFANITDALAVASEGDQIWVAVGEYTLNSPISMIHGVKMYGSFAGTETSLGQRTLPILHGPGTSSAVAYFGSSVVQNNNNGLTREDVFDGFTITNGMGDHGGGMRNVGVSPTIANCGFYYNSAFDGGGAVYNENASPLIVNSVFSNNNVMFGQGGAIENVDGSNTTLMNCLFTANSSGQSASSVYNSYANINLINCTISYNTQDSQGTIYSYGGNVAVRNSIIYGNNGGITAQETELSVTYSLVEGMNASETDHNLAGTTNPQFVGETDWRLLPCSPAINRGTNEVLPDIPAVSNDLANNARIFNVQTDMGAYETQLVPGPGTLPASGDQVTLPVYAGATAITSDCKTFGLIEPTGTPGSLGNVTIKAFLAAGNTVSEGQKVFVKRHYDITPSGTDGPAKVTLFFAKQDFDTYNQAFGNANNATLPANLKVVQYHGTSPYGFPGTYSGPTQLITNVTVTESEDHTMYLVSFQASGFSGFFVSGQSEAALPVTLVSFQAKKRENVAYLQWQTSSEINSRQFDIERSTDGKQWHYLGQVTAQGSEATNTDYSYTDALPQAGTNLYRLKMIDRAADGGTGSFAYSRIVALEFAEAVALFPNPAVGVSEVSLKGVKPENIRNLRLFDRSGRLLRQPAPRQGSLNIDHIGAGLYTVEVQMSDGSTYPLKLVVTH